MKKIHKIIFSSSLFAASLSCVLATSFDDYKNSTILKTDSNLNADTVTSQYDHPNYFQMPETMPAGFNGYNLLASTNNSQVVQTTTGVLGISKDSSTFYFTTYSGKIVWAQDFKSSVLLKKFYESQGWDLNNLKNLKIKEWLKSAAITTKNVLIILLGDGVNTIVTCIDLDTGLFYPATDQESYNLDVTKVFAGLDGNVYTRITEIATAIVISQNYDFSKTAKWLTLNPTTGISITDDIDASALLATIASLNKDLKVVSFFGTGRFTFLYLVDSDYDTTATGISPGEYCYNQYIVSVRFTNGALSWGNAWKTPSKYITSSSTLNVDNWVERVYIASTTRIVFLSGSSTHPYINDFTFTSQNTCTSAKYLELVGDTINSVAFGSDNKVYLSAKTSATNNFQYFIDCSGTTLVKSNALSSTTNSNTYLLPVLGNTDAIYLFNYDATNCVLTYNSVIGTTLGDAGTATYGYWSLNNVNNLDVWYGLGLNYLPSSIQESTLTPYYSWTTLVSSGNLDTYLFHVDASDDSNGTLKYSFTVGYVPDYKWQNQEQFTLYFYVSNLYGITKDFVLNWLDNTTAINDFKTRYAIGVTAQDIIDNFINYNITTKNGTSLEIDTSMISLVCSDDFSQLTVKINIPYEQLPDNVSTTIEPQLTHTYTGFVSYSGYTIVQNSADLSSVTSTIYPSELTNDQVVTSFLSIDSRISTTMTAADFDIDISNIDDINGSLSMSVSLNETGKTKIPNFDGLPDEIKATYQGIINNYKFQGFKAISSDIDLKVSPTIEDIVADSNNEYSPSEIWDQYLAFSEGLVNEADVILLQNLSFDLTDFSNLEITCLNETTCNHDGVLNLDIKIKNGSELAVDYSGNAFEKSTAGKLLFSQNLLTSSGMTSSYTLNWNIVSSKFFYIEDLNNGSAADEKDNVYSFDVKNNSPFGESLDVSSSFSSSITIDDIASLLKLNGYTYEIMMETNVEEGYVVAKIYLSSNSNPLYEGETSSSDLNNVKTVYLYNFATPSGLQLTGPLKNAMIASLSAAVVIILIVLTWYFIWKHKVHVYKKDLNTKKK